MIELKNVTYTYSKDTPFEKEAVAGVDLVVEKGEILGIIGHTGSGKSTLVQLMNGLLTPTKGEVRVEGNKVERVLPQIGMVFQYPENQIFEETVYKEIAFGPANMGMGGEELERRVAKTAEIMDIPAEIMKKSPHFLSGGQKRRIAIAGILAMEPGTIIFDEPTAGLDPRAKNHLIDTILTLNREHGVTVILVSHSMEEIARTCNRILVMRDGKVAHIGTVTEVFSHEDELLEMGLDIPEIAQLMRRLGYHDCWTVEQATEKLKEAAC
ncbi:MAG: energy-coupling factor transporter ATPase [Clostridiales bacterium]|jgi:energy-coupling factor transport system ATP-binding protein|nr:energy-coupling factor transporter ATPase [Clostridiales bacterium]